jgi:hypothetical protein
MGRLQWYKYTIEFVFDGIQIDLCIDVAQTVIHTHVAITEGLKACVEKHSQHLPSSIWKELLDSARMSGIAQARHQPRGTKLKTVVLSILVAAALKLMQPCLVSSLDGTLPSLAFVLLEFVKKLRSHTLRLTYDWLGGRHLL